MRKDYSLILSNSWIFLVPIIYVIIGRAYINYPYLGIYYYLPPIILSSNGLLYCIFWMLCMFIVVPIYYLIISINSGIYLKTMQFPIKRFVFLSILFFICYVMFTGWIISFPINN